MTALRNFDEIRKELKNYLTQRQIYDVILDSFDTLKLDKEKVELCWILLCDSNLFPSFRGLDVKCKELSEKFRLEGNHAFASRKDLQAIRCYTLASGHAEPNSKELILAIANRSAVLSCLSEHSNCLRDIDFAIARDYPDKLKYKLLERKGKSLLSLRQIEEAKSAFKDALSSLKLCDLNNSKLEKVRNDIADLMEQCLHITSESDNYTNNSNSVILPTLSYGRNEIISCASQCIDIAYSDEMGRHLVATRDIFPGDVLAVEEPYVSILLPECAGLYCSHCLIRCHSLQPCSLCTQVYFCSLECENEALKNYHRIECTILKGLLELGCEKLELLAVRTVIEAARQGSDLLHLIHHAINLDQTFVQPTRRGFVDGVYQSSTYDAVHSLEGNSHHRTNMDLFRRAVEAAIIVEALDRFTPFFKSQVESDLSNSFNHLLNSELVETTFSSFKRLKPYFRQLEVNPMGGLKAQVGGLLLKYLQVTPSNAHEVSEMLVNRSANTSESIEVGGALYPLLSLTNHSCDPNVVRHSYCGDTVVLRAIQCIPIGQQVLDCYGYHHAVHEINNRQTSLMFQYHFNCQCIACLNDWPLYQNLPSSDPLYLPGADVNKVKRSLEKYSKVLSDILKSRSSDNLAFLFSHLKLLHDSVERPCREYSSCQEAIKQCLSVQANHYICHTPQT